MQKGGEMIFKKWLKSRSIIILVMLIGQLTFFSNVTSAGESNVSDEMNVVFIIDTSYSMNETDKDKISMEMLKLFTDISYSKKTRIGFVAYNDIIEGVRPLTEVTSSKAKEDFKRSLDSIERFGRTDIGLGLKKGWELLGEADQSRQSFIVLLTDGEIDIDSSKSQRTAADSMNDINDVVAQAAAQKIPIYTIAMGRDGVDVALLQDIADKTGAANYIADAPQDLMEIFNHIFAAGSKARFVPIATVRATGETQELNVTLPYSHVAEGNIVFLSSSALKDTQVFHNSKNISFYNTQYYSTVKIPHPEQQDVKIRFKSSPDDVVKVSMLLRYDLKGELKIDGEPKSGQSVKLQANFVDSNTGQPIIDKNFYNTFIVNATIRNLDTQEETKIVLQPTDNGWEAQYVFHDKGRYSYSVEIDNKFYNETTKSIEVNVGDAFEWDKAAIIVLILVMLALIYYRERRPKFVFTGKINAYYLKLKQCEEEEIPPLTIPLQNYKDQEKVNLFDMLHALNADQGLAEGKKVWFTPGIDKTIILSHKSACTIMVGQTLVCKNEKYVLHYGDKIYVTYPKNIAEIELHYKGVKSTETCNY